MIKNKIERAVLELQWCIYMNDLNVFKSELEKIYGEYLVSNDLFLTNKMFDIYKSFDFSEYDITYKILVLNILHDYINKILIEKGVI